MPAKNNSHVVITIIGALILTTILSIGFYISQRRSSIEGRSNIIKQSIPNQKQPIKISPEVINEEVLTRTVNDIVVEITSAQSITGMEIGICYTTPDNGEWYPMPGHLFYGKYEVYPDEIEFLDNEILADGKNTGTRCALIRYLIDDLSTLTTPIEFSILQFYAPGREMYSPCEELQQRLDTNPKAQAYGLKMECKEASDGNVSVTLVGHNQSVAKEEAGKTLDEIAEAEVVGPWEFTINELER